MVQSDCGRFSLRSSARVSVKVHFQAAAWERLRESAARAVVRVSARD